MTKKIFIVLVIILSIPLFFNSCQKEGVIEDLNAPETEMFSSNFLKSAIPYNAVVNTLYADSTNENAGTVSIWNDCENLYVKYETTGDWVLSETKLYVGSEDLLPLNGAGNVKRGKFPLKEIHDPVATNHTEIISLEDLDDCFIVAAHADVLLMDGDEVIGKETAWGYGDGTWDGRSWGWYLNYCACCEDHCGDHVVIFRDNNPWFPAQTQEEVLELLGYTEGPEPGQYEIIPSSLMGTHVLDVCRDLVIITGDQVTGFYDNYVLNAAAIEAFVSAGGRLIWEAVDNGWSVGNMLTAGVALPGGVSFTQALNVVNYVVSTDPPVDGLLATIHGTYASHEYFTNLPAGATTYCTDTGDNATLIEYSFGAGVIMMTGQPIEYNYVQNPEMEELLPRIYAYMTCNEVVLPPEPAATDQIAVAAQRNSSESIIME